MPKRTENENATSFSVAHKRWHEEYKDKVLEEERRENKSGIEIKPLYRPDDWDGGHMDDLGFPGQEPGTRAYLRQHASRPTVGANIN